ncbi:hypothetical protein VTN00DRAFT_8140 [Thermoascus crustaceus]|uniref:uncharacterized protein n=1 Tax=Thermoascus crustaceus TaxID=5088 RepID=UPI0037434139
MRHIWPPIFRKMCSSLEPLEQQTLLKKAAEPQIKRATRILTLLVKALYFQAALPCIFIFSINGFHAIRRNLGQLLCPSWKQEPKTRTPRAMRYRRLSSVSAHGAKERHGGLVGSDQADVSRMISVRSYAFSQLSTTTMTIDLAAT